MPCDLGIRRALQTGLGCLGGVLEGLGSVLGGLGAVLGCFGGVLGISRGNVGVQLPLEFNFSKIL